MYVIIGLLIGIIVLRIASVVILEDVDVDLIVERRKRQHESKVRERFKGVVDKKMKVSKKRQYEILFKQAGVKIELGDFIGLSVVLGIVFLVLTILSLKNLFLALVFFVFGFSLPKQILGYIRNRRLALFEKQLSAFFPMIIERYEMAKNIKEAFELLEQEFKFQEPIHSEVALTVNYLKAGFSVEKALEEFALRTGNKYMEQFADAYGIGKDIGRGDSISNNFREVHKQFNEDRQNKHLLATRISKPKNEAYITLMFMPVVALYQHLTSDDFVQIMTSTAIGQIVTGVVVAIFIASFWFINTKIGAPIE